MLSPQDKRKLKAIASTSKNRYQIGKREITDTVIDMLNKALIAHELIKIDVMKNSSDNLMELALELSEKLKADIVDIIGRVIILYKKNKDNPKIKF